MKKIALILLGLVCFSFFVFAESSVSSPSGDGRQVVSEKFELRPGESFTGEYEKDGVVQGFRVTLVKISSPSSECLESEMDYVDGERYCWESFAKATLAVEPINPSGATIWGNSRVEFSVEHGVRVPTIVEKESYALSAYEIKSGSVTVNFEKTPCPVQGGSLTRTAFSIPFRMTGCEKEAVEPRPIDMKTGDTLAEEYVYGGVTKKIWITLKEARGPAPDKCSQENMQKYYSKGIDSLTCITEYILIEVRTQTSDDPVPFVRDFEFRDTIETSKAKIFDEYEINLLENYDGEAGFELPNTLDVRPINGMQNEPENNGEDQTRTAIEEKESTVTLPEIDEPPPVNKPPMGDTNPLIKEAEKISSAGLQVEVFENRLFVKSGNEKKEVKTLPEQAKQKIKEKENLDCENLELTEKQGSLAYTCKTKQTGKFFGLFPMEFEVTAEINAEQEAEVTVNKPWWSFLVFE